MMENAFYFGKYDQGSGHVLHVPGPRTTYYDERKALPFSEHILDGALLPPQLPQTEGRATVVHLNGWTILTFWDRTGDRRGNSSSSFILRGTHDFAASVELAKAAFPAIWQRFTFPVVEYKP